MLNEKFRKRNRKKHKEVGVERFQIFRFRFGSVPNFSVPVRFGSKILGAGSVRFQYCKTKSLLLHEKKQKSHREKALYKYFLGLFSVFVLVFFIIFSNIFLLIIYFLEPRFSRFLTSGFGSVRFQEKVFGSSVL